MCSICFRFKSLFLVNNQASINLMSSNTNLVFCSQEYKSFTSKVDIYASALVAVLIFSRPRAITPTVMDARGGKFPDEIQGGPFQQLVSFVRCINFESLFFSETFLSNFRGRFCGGRYVIPLKIGHQLELFGRS